METKLNILIVEDDPNLGPLLDEYLNAKGFNATLTNNGQKGVELFFKSKYDFLILDVMMPIKDGFTVAKEIRSVNKTVPVLFLTAKSMKEDMLEGFKIGADDYMTKPFNMEELMARINAILRRSAQKSESKDLTVFDLGNIKFDTKKQELSGENFSHKLTTKENELLKILSTNLNEIVERNFALSVVWGDDSYFNGRSMDVYIAKLRKYLSSEPRLEIVNVHGKGFKLILNN